MAKKKDNRQQQKAQQRRAEKTHERKGKNQPRPQKSEETFLPPELEMLMPLIEYVEETAETPEEIESLLNLLVEESIEFINEPEFEEVVINPLDTINALAAFETVYPSNEEDDEEQEMSVAELRVFNEIFSDTITPDVQTKIITSLETIQIRYVNSPMEAKVRDLIACLKEIAEPEIWISIGLIRALIEQCIEASYEIMEKLNAARAAEI